MHPPAPHDFHLDNAFKIQSQVPVAFVLPTTTEVQATVRQLGIASVGNLQLGSLYSPVSFLSSLKRQEKRPALISYTDQVVDQANTSILVRTNAGDRYISPFEAVLNSIYGYTIIFWTGRGFIDCQAGTDDISRIASLVVEHLDSAEQLGAAWTMGSYQVFRGQESRRFNAKRKLRLYRSAVINAFRDAPASSEAKRLLAKTEDLEKLIEAWAQSNECH